MKNCFKTWIRAITLSCLAWLTGVSSVRAGDADATVLTNIGQIRALSSQEIARKPSVRLEASVTLCLPKLLYMWIQDESDGLPISFQGKAFSVEPGDRVLVTGRLVPVDDSAQLEPDEIVVLEKGKLPDAPERTAQQLNTFADENRRVTTEGQVLSAIETGRRWSLELESRNSRFRVELPKQTNDNTAAKLLNSTVRVRGVCIKQIIDWGEKTKPTLLLQNSSDLVILRSGWTNVTADPYRIAVQSISSLTHQQAIAKSSVHVRVQGIVLDQRLGENMIVRDDTGRITAETRLTIPVKDKERVDVWGTPAWDGSRVYLKESTYRAIASDKPVAVEIAATPAPNKPAELPLLTKARQIRELPVEQAAWKYPVRLRAVVTLRLPLRWKFFVQDETAGIYVRVERNQPGPKPGDLVEIEGFSNPGGFAPIVDPTKVTVVGTAPLPEPFRANLLQMATGQYDAQWVEARGVVRSQSFENGLLQLKVSDPSGTFTVDIPTASEPTNLLDAVVSVRGVCSSQFNEKRQHMSVMIWPPSLDYVQVEVPGVADPLNLPMRSILSLSQFQPRETLQRRVKVAGVVTLCRPGQSFFVQDSSAAIEVFTSQNDEVKPGDQVLAAGYPAPGDFSRELRDAVFRVQNHGSMPTPKLLKAAHALDPELDNTWVQMEARLLNQNTIGRARVLTLQLAGWVFEAQCLAPAEGKELPPAGSLLRLTGVYHVLADEARSPISFQLLVPSTGNIQALEQPSWLTTERLMMAGGVMAVIAAATMLWVVLLRRRVSEQTRRLRERLEREAALEQRYRDIFESANDVIFTHDLEGRITSINPAGLRMSGYTAEEVEGLTIDRLIAPEDRDRARQMRETALANGEAATYELGFIAKDGRRRKVEVSKRAAFKDGKPVGVHGIARDVTERKRIEERYRPIIGTALDGFWLADMHGRVLDVNDAYCNLIGYSREELLSMSIPDIEAVENPEETAARIRRIMEVGRDRFETHHRCKDGRIVDIEVSVNCLKAEERMSVFLRDITERKQAGKIQEATFRISQAVNTARNLDDLYREIHSVLVELMPADNFYIALYDPTTDILSFPYRVDQYEPVVPARKPGRSLTEYVLRTGNPLFGTREVVDELVAKEEVVLLGVRSAEWLGVPLKIGERTLGVMTVQSYTENVRFGQGDMDILRFVSTQVAIAIEHKRAEAALAEASSLLETLLEHSPDVIYFKDRQSRFFRFSKSFGRLFNLPDPDVLKGKTDFDFFTEEHARPAYEDEQEIIRTGQSMVGKLEKETHADGRVTWALTNKMPWRDKDGNIIGTFGISKDATALKEAEGKLACERELLRTLLDNVPDRIYFKDHESRFVRVSRSKLLKDLEHSPKLQARFKQTSAAADPTTSSLDTDLLVGLSDFDVFSEAHARPAFEDEQEIIRTGKPVIGKVEKQARLDGSTSWSLTTKMPWRGKDGSIVGTFGISKDITALKQAEAELEVTHKRLVEVSRMAGMAEVATDVLHNVGNVLTSVNVSCSLVIDRMQQCDFSNLAKIPPLLEENAGRLDEFLRTDPKGKHIPEYLAVLAQTFKDHKTFLQDELNRLRQHIDHIKQIVAMQQNYARVAGVEEAIEVAQLVDDALHINEAALDRHTVRVHREMGPVPPILVDKHKVLQILVNLIRNAKYALSASEQPDRLMTVRVDRNGGDHVQIQVTDNGAGIAPENLTRIFAHGFTTRGDGHGFGLHSGALAARDLGGSLSARSDGLGKGATFTLLVPLKPPHRT